MTERQSPSRFCRTPEDFEEVAAEWLRFWGYLDARKTESGPDGGADVVASEAVAQVKAWMTPVGSPEIQQLKGVAHDGRMAMFFSLTDYTAAAQEFAQKAEIVLFRFAGYDGSIEPSNDHARHFLSQAATDRSGGQGAGRLHLAELSDAIQAAILRMLEIRGYILICCKSNDYFVQFTTCNIRSKSGEYMMRVDTGNDPDFVGETVSNGFLPVGAMLTKEQLDLLVRLGWLEPDRDGANFHQRWIGPPVVTDAVALAVATLVQVHGVRELKDISIRVEDL